MQEERVPHIANPILPGFNPDPSIVRVDQDYFIATSTFEWYPGVQLHHSRDLQNWRLVARPLNRASQLNLLGEADSCGIWAPCLSHWHGQFYLVYTDVKRYAGAPGSGRQGVAPRDLHNYLVVSPTIEGPWSEPVRLNSSGFDPSLFHAPDGRKFLVNMLWDHRPDRQRFAGIVLQQYDEKAQRLIGERRVIFQGTELGFTEAPHLYHRDGWFYLIVAEGGTSYGHAVVLARSRQLTGPYELHPEGPIVTSRDRPDAELQKAGHADLFETPDGQPYLVYLCGRPLPRRGRCPLGRETALIAMRWCDDGWLRTLSGEPVAELRTPAPIPLAPATEAPKPRQTFDTPQLPACFQWLRSPYPEELFSLSQRPGYLRLFGRESLGSTFRQALVARRQDSLCYSAQTRLEFSPRNFQHLAGLACYYNGSKFHYLFISRGDSGQRELRVWSRFADRQPADNWSREVALPETGAIELRAEVDFERLYFAHRVAGQSWIWWPECFDYSGLSDEVARPGEPAFTGAFVGMACQDLEGTATPADFDYFEYQARAYAVDPRTSLPQPDAGRKGDRARVALNPARG